MGRSPLIICDIKINQTHKQHPKKPACFPNSSTEQALANLLFQTLLIRFLIAILDSFICSFEGINFGITESCIHPSVSWISFSYFKVSETPVDEGLKIAIISQVNYYSSVMSLQSDSLQLQTSSSCLLYFGSCFLKLFRID